MRRARQVWVELIRQYERSGLSLEAYAAKREIPSKTLRWWIWKLQREDPPSLLPVRVIASTAPTARWSGQETAVIEAELPDGLRLRFPATAAVDAVVEMVSRLRRC